MTIPTVENTKAAIQGYHEEACCKATLLVMTEVKRLMHIWHARHPDCTVDLRVNVDFWIHVDNVQVHWIHEDDYFDEGADMSDLRAQVSDAVLGDDYREIAEAIRFIYSVSPDYPAEYITNFEIKPKQL